MNLHRFLAMTLEPENREVCWKFWRIHETEGQRQFLLDLLTERFGAVPPLLEARIRTLTNPDTLLLAACQVRTLLFPVDLRL